MMAKMLKEINCLGKGMKSFPVSLSKTGLEVGEEAEAKKDYY